MRTIHLAKRYYFRRGINQATTHTIMTVHAQQLYSAVQVHLREAERLRKIRLLPVLWLLSYSGLLFAQADSLLDEAVIHQGLQKARATNDTALLAAMSFEMARQKGVAYTERDSILYYLKQSEQLYTQLQDAAGLVGVHNNLSYYYQVSEEYALSIAYLQKIQDYALLYHDTSRLINYHLALANIYALQQKWPKDSVLHHYELAERYAMMTQDTMNMLVMDYHFALDYLERDTLLTEARRRLERALALEPHTDKGYYFLPALHEQLGDYFVKTQDYTRAIAQYKQAIKNGEAFEDATLLRACYEKLKTCYLALGQYKQAVAALEQKQAYQDILFDEEKMRSIERLEMEFETEQKDNAIALLRQEKAARELQTQRQRYIIFSTLAGLVLISVIAVLLILNYRYRNRANRIKAEQQEAINRMQQDVYTNITHEFRTPITVIQGMTEQIPGSSKEKELIRRNSDNLLRLVNQLLDLSKLDEGQLKLQPIQADIIAFLGYVVESLQSMAAAKGIDLHFQPSSEQLIMDYDPDKMQQILHNLLSNAIKYTPPAGTVQLLAQKTKDHLQLTIKDNGEGIPAHDLPRIFDRFYQVEQQHRTRGGTGVGLAVVRELVHLMQGTIEVESTWGEGSTFTLLFPLSRKAPLPTTPTGTSPALTQDTSFTLPAPADATLALLIEDNVDVITYLQDCLSPQYQIETALDGQAGVDKALDIIPDIIICDVMMPRKDGFEVCALLKNDERTSHVPIILLTAKATREDRLTGLQTGADAYLTKPFDRQELYIRLQQLVALRRNLQQRYKHGLLIQTAISPDDRFITKIQKFVVDNLDDEQLDVSAICRHVGLSRMQVHRKLKALTQKTTTQFVRSIRMQHARQLLQKTDLHIAEIAFRVGYSDPSYFSRQFSEEFGQPPSHARK